MWLAMIVGIVIAVNAIGAIITVFRSQRDITAIWAWLLVLLLLPILGFIIYFIFGRKLRGHRLQDLKTQQQLGIDSLVHRQRDALDQGHQLLDVQTARVSALVRTLLFSSNALVTTGNTVDVIADRDDFFTQLFEDLHAASEHIHIEAYTIHPDKVGLALRQLLVDKAKAGVAVRVIYDAFGSRQLNSHFWAPLLEVGGQAERFIATRLGRFNPRINFRNHRKLIIIDGQYAYLGGFNLGRETHRRPITRDTQLRIQGQAVSTVQAQFLIDWNATSKKQPVAAVDALFQTPQQSGHVTMQLVAGGPEQDIESIKLGYLGLINLAKQSIWIATPYFVPDDSLLDALTIAANAGIDVRVMVPRKTNQRLMAKASRFYLNQLVQAGGKGFLYEAGFLHAKTIVVDGKYVTTGSANFDVRSFKLNFEVAGFMYDRQIGKQFQQLFMTDMRAASPFTKKTIATQSGFERLSEELSRLLAPIL